MSLKRAEYHARLGAVETREDLEQAIWNADHHEVPVASFDAEEFEPVKFARNLQTLVSAPGFAFTVNTVAEVTA